MRSRLASRLVILLVVQAYVASLSAQGSPAAACDGRRIGEVVIERSVEPPLDDRVPGALRSTARLVLFSPTTHAAAVRPFLLLRPGMRCIEGRRRESERVLRAQPYLADALVRAVPNADGGVDLHVTTVDEVARILRGDWADGGVSALGVGSNNVNGQGIRAFAGWEQGGGYRDGFRGEAMLSHTFGDPHRLSLMAESAPLGTAARAAWERPFWSTYQRLGWYLGAHAEDGHAQFLRPDAAPMALPYEASRLDMGGVLRIGGESVGAFAGPFVSHERFEPLGDALRVGPNGLEADSDSTLNGRYAGLDGWRASLVVGGRWLNFVRAEGLDALVGPQDIGRGLQLAILRGVGTGIDAGRRYYGGEAFIGVGTPRSYLAVRGFWEQRLAPDRDSDVVASGRLRWFVRTGDQSLVTVSGEFAGGWRPERPMQLLLGDAAGGIRGFEGVPAVGALRAVARVDYRRNIGGIGRAIVAWSAFADVGGVDGDDVPYGAYSGINSSAGLALLAALPRESRRIWRLELAYPFGELAPAQGLRLRLGASSPLREFWRDPQDVARARAVIPPPSLFGFP